ncbi:hypothetical protein QJQ45_005268 [Haematococcus lacustris]|nr:hypothetical protein QJQ45_005268 [Haematococcus lacustris]
MNIAKTFPELAAAIEAYKQENEDVVTPPSSKSTTRAGNGWTDKGRFANDLLLTAIQADHANLADVHYGLAIVDKWFGDATRKVPMEFVDEVMEPRGLVAQVCAFKFIWSDRRSRLLLGRMWIMSFVFFNTRVMTRKEHHASAEAQEEWESFIAAQVVKEVEVNMEMEVKMEVEMEVKKEVEV